MALGNDNWRELGERLDGLALKLKMHLRQSESSEVTEAYSKLRKAVADAFDAAHDAVRDEAVRADIREAGRLFGDAVSTTFSTVSDDFKEFVGTAPDRAGRREVDRR
jgi:hypothetical protein